MKNSVEEATEDALLMVLEVENATATPRCPDSDMLILVLTITVKIPMLMIMLDFLAYNPLEEVLEASASLVLSAQVQELLLPVSASSILALVLDLIPKFNFKSAQRGLLVGMKEEFQLADTKAQSTALIL